MKFWAVIPSRYGSTRFPGKPLAPILGKPLLQRVIEQVKTVRGLTGILVATDHDEIARLCHNLKVECVMTDSELPSGTDRIYQALKRSELSLDNDDIILNIQGDEPLIPPDWIEKMVTRFKMDIKVQMMTLAHPLDWEELESLNSVKVLINDNQEAIYFSRFAIPHSRERDVHPLSFKHIGVYGYKYRTLEKFCQTPPTDLEKAESLEQLRALQTGTKIHVLKVVGHIQGVDVPQDILKVERILQTSGVK